MSITNYTVRFRRQVQPASYEAAEAEVEFSGVVEDGDAAKLTAEALSTAKKQALAALGKGQKSQPDTAETETTEEKPKPKGRGRPKKEDKSEASHDSKSEKSQDTKPEAEPEEELKISAEDMQTKTSEATQALGGTAEIKKLIASQFGVARLGEIPEERRQEYLTALEKLVEDNTV